MSDITVLRVEVAGVGSGNEGSLESNKKGSTGASLAAGALGGAVVGSLNHNDGIKDRLKKAVEEGSMFFGRGDSREERLYNRTTAREMYTNSKRGSAGRYVARSMYKRNISAPTGKQITTGITGVSAVGTQAFSMYSNYKKAGYEMSGATHAAAMQSRYSQAASSGTQIAIGFMINPVAGAAMVAMKAYQLAQTNRKQLFEIQKSQFMSQILQRNLVRTVAERRF